jgi:hypothetical protein
MKLRAIRATSPGFRTCGSGMDASRIRHLVPKTNEILPKVLKFGIQYINQYIIHSYRIVSKKHSSCYMNLRVSGFEDESMNTDAVSRFKLGRDRL